MKYSILVWAGLWRKPLRSVLTLLSIATAFLLFGALRGITEGMDVVVKGMSPNRMRVQSKEGYRDPLPLAYLGQIQRIPGVSLPGYVSVFESYYREPQKPMFAAAIGGDVFASKPPEFKLAKDQAEAFKNTRTGAIVGLKLAQNYGWKVGDKVTLHSNVWTKRDGTSDWVFDIVGFFDMEGQHDLAQTFYFNYDYFDQERTRANGTVSMYVLLANDPAVVAAAIDRQFANSSNPTLTQADRDWIRAQMRQAGDLNLIVNSVVGAALFTLLFLTGNTMMQSVRERVQELAVLKTIGYSDIAVQALVVAEALVLCLSGALLGLLLARALFIPLSAIMQSPITMPGSVFVSGLIVAMATAIASVWLPSVRVHRLSVVDALAGR